MAAREEEARTAGPERRAGAARRRGARDHRKRDPRRRDRDQAGDRTRRRRCPTSAASAASGATGIDGVAEPQTYELDATYYDTAGLDLLRSKVTLRRRTGGKDAGWHLKLPAAAGARTEVGLPLSAGEPGDVPAELAGLVRGAARGRPLVPVARLENARVVRHLLDATAAP